LALKDYATEITLEEQIESIKIINKYLFKKSLTEKELNQTVLREDLVNRESKQTRGPEDEDDDSRYCMEEALARKILRENKIITCNDDCYIFNGKFYRKMNDITELERIIHSNYKANLKEKQRKETIKFIKLKSWLPSYELNKNWNEIVFRNGIYNISDNTLYPHSDTAYNTIYIDTNYFPAADYSKIIDDFFNQISGKQEDKKALLYEIVGYCLIRKQVFEKFFICYGGGSTGKSTYLKLIRNLIGIANSSFLSLNNLEETFMPAELFGKLINIGDDIAYKGIKESDVLKKLVTGEMFAAQQKFKQQPLNFSNFAKLIFTTNRLPEVYDRTSGFYRRVTIIAIDNKIENPDPFFLDKLTERDYEYLLCKAIDYVRKALKRGKLTECIDSELALEMYKQTQSSVLMFISDNQYNSDRLELKPCMEIFKEYENYCRETGFKNLKKVNFDKELCEALDMEKKNTTFRGENLTWRFVKCKKF
jgi:putative DNA primase/helicase